VDESDLRIRNAIYSSFVRTGNAPSAATLGGELGVAAEDVEAAYRRLHEARALVLERGGAAIRMLHPFSAVETPHRVETAGRRWHANCAWDALGIPAALREDEARIESRCPDCGEPLELELRGGELARGEELLVHFVVPARRWWDDIGFT
jgi:Alkylmercury lyase